MKWIKAESFKYYVLMHLVVLAFGFTGILGKLIELDFYQIVFFRMLIAGLSLILFLKIRKRRFRIKDKKTLFKVIGVGIIVVLHWLTFFKAIQVSTASVGVLCMATSALHVSWLEPLLMRRKFSFVEFILGILVIIGVIVVTNNVETDQILGLLWGLLSAFLSALFSVFNAYLNRVEEISSASLTIYEMLTGAVLLFIGLGFGGRLDASFFQMTFSDLGWLLFLGIICTSAAFMIMIDVINKLGAYTAALTVNLEPIYAIVLAIFILSENEILGTQFYIGAFFIIVIVFINPVLKRLEDKNARKRRLRRIQARRLKNVR